MKIFINDHWLIVSGNSKETTIFRTIELKMATEMVKVKFSEIKTGNPKGFRFLLDLYYLTMSCDLSLIS